MLSWRSEIGSREKSMTQFLLLLPFVLWHLFQFIHECFTILGKLIEAIFEHVLWRSLSGSENILCWNILIQFLWLVLYSFEIKWNNSKLQVVRVSTSSNEQNLATKFSWFSQMGFIYLWRLHMSVSSASLSLDLINVPQDITVKKCNKVLLPKCSALLINSWDSKTKSKQSFNYQATCSL